MHFISFDSYNTGDECYQSPTSTFSRGGKMNSGGPHGV